MKKKIMLIALGSWFIVGCATIHPTAIDLQTMTDKVKKCMGVIEDVPLHFNPPVKADHVMCNGKKAKGCYENGNITLTYKGKDNIIYHELTHGICDKSKGMGNDPQHACLTPFGDNAYLECGGGLSYE